MEKEPSWIEGMKQSVQLDEINPHYSNKDVQSYLQYYRFDIQYLHEYRCGFIDANGKKIFLQFFLQENPTATVYFVHGYLDHSGGLSRTVNDLMRKNYQVVTVDLPGHGFSEGEEGVVSSFEDYLIAVKEGFRSIENLCKTSIYGLGHSTGAALLFHASSEKKISLDGLILVAPLFHPFQWTLFKGFLLMIGKVFSQKKRAFKKNSNDRMYRKFVMKDPLQVKVLKSAWVRAMHEWQADINECPDCDMPVYYMQGTRDTTLDWRRNIAFYLEKCPSIQIALFEKGRHQLLNERTEIRELVHKQISAVLRKWECVSQEKRI
ncbi:MULTISPECIES: alpha/beta hydrolase [Bacillaceae]|uniref:Alpha/beta hydrolase n=1 Tax=Evansella alkalicola TaxID=745819 RepID=A0ABS6JVY7_9BACI|nr:MULTISPECIES: alpha/beta hydrolase [Bacillaceae]MBU9721407.1 alpha/beta hydrolase [Bacillus alkalicola]